MTDGELLALKKVGVADAARYLQNGTTIQDIRVLAKAGKCPFCEAYQRKTGSQKHVYRINVGLLMAYKHGELGMMGGVPAETREEAHR